MNKIRVEEWYTCEFDKLTKKLFQPQIIQSLDTKQSMTNHHVSAQVQTSVVTHSPQSRPDNWTTMQNHNQPQTSQEQKQRMQQHSVGDQIIGQVEVFLRFSNEIFLVYKN